MRRAFALCPAQERRLAKRRLRAVADILGIALALAFALGGCARVSRQSAVGFYCDTVVTVTAYAENAKIVEEILAASAEYEALLSKTSTEGDVWRINHAEGAPVAVDARTLKVLTCAQEISALSGGAFDITVAPVSALWDFTGETAAIPEAEALKRAVALVDYRKLRIDDGVVTLPAGMSVDLGGVAKGYIADEIADKLRAAGVESALLNFGGNVVAVGSKPDGAPWRIGLRDPWGGADDALGEIAIVDRAAVTSGVYERGFDLDGVRYHHILDPQTGYPLQNGLMSATIIADDSMLADALSTACFALGAEEGLALAKRAGAEAIFVLDTGEIRSTDNAGLTIY